MTLSDLPQRVAFPVAESWKEKGSAKATLCTQAELWDKMDRETLQGTNFQTPRHTFGISCLALAERQLWRRFQVSPKGEMKLPYVLSRRVGQEFATGLGPVVTKPETWEEASDEEDDFPFKDWVATLGHRTLRGPFVSKRQQKVSQWLLEKERQQKQKWQENQWKRKPRLLPPLPLLPPVTHLPPELLPLEQPSPRLLGSGRPEPRAAKPRRDKAPVMAPMRHGLQVDKPKAPVIVSAQECSQQPTPPPVSTEGMDESCPIGWGRLHDYVNGVRIGPGSLFSHPWDGPTPSGIHPLKPKRRSHDLK
ncbi:unnamed protein product [Cladocopium goreaui]|uniref:Uncharacterized protein n=1 Tax=Cladocopium goreaui TaxID=2562237 RepID=A0A9P1GJ92_9DINO|nr:unnamed protein product [Cladocopium goreaui]